MVTASLLALLLSTAVPATPEPASMPTGEGAAQAPSAVSLVPRMVASHEFAFPAPPIDRFLLDSMLAMKTTFLPRDDEVWMLGLMLTSAVAVYAFDVPLHAAAVLIPDPMLPWKMTLAESVTLLGEGLVDVGLFLVVGVLGGRAGQRAAWAGFEALIATAVFSRVVKYIVRLERPSYDPNEHHWFNQWTADAMPSGHTMTAFSVAAVLASEWPLYAPAFYFLATWVGLSRVQLSTHWPADVVVGAALGTLFGLEAWRLTRQWELEVQPWAAPTGAGLSVRKTF